MSIRTVSLETTKGKRMDKRTLKIRELKQKLEISRSHIRHVVGVCADHIDSFATKGHAISESWLIKRGIEILESTKD